MPDLYYPTNESLYFQNELATVIDHADGYVRIDWCAAPMQSQLLRAVYEHALELLKLGGYTKILTDHRDIPPMWPADREWLAHYWAPRAVTEGGYRRCAVVQAHDALSRLAVTEVVQQLAHVPLTVRYFADAMAAAKWLVGCKKD